ncbi:hypothetical protein JCM8097_008451 [Rhodosporidiobolus ruineniae]
MEDDRPTATHVDQEEEAEDAVPDWSQFAAFKRANTDKDAAALPGRSTLVPFIPKRGEKDFEPLPPGSSFPAGSKEATLSTHQQHLLSSSRHALYTALASGSRTHSSRAHNSFTWRPEIGRASCDSEDGLTAHGVHFGNIGHFNVERKRLELLPEEALYMVERGGVELWREFEEELPVEGGKDGETESVKKRVPMSVQQAWAECIGQYDLTPERYQVYAFLRRLGYVLVRARPIPNTARPVYIPPPPPLYLRLLALFTHPLFSLRDTLVRAVREVQMLALRSVKRVEENKKGRKEVKKVEWRKTRKVGSRDGRSRPLAAGGRWTSYDQIFSRLQIIPTCALDTPSRPLRAPLPHTPSSLTPLASDSSSSISSIVGAEGDDLPSYTEYPFQPFYHIYKPVTKYKKNNPPPPDFRLVIINGTTTPLPTLYELSSLFSTIPLPSDYDEDLDPLGPTALAPNRRPPQQRVGPSAAEQKKEADKAGVAPSPAPATALQKAASYLPSSLRALLPDSLLPPSPTAAAGGGGGAKKRPPPPPKTPSPYPALKTGRRSVLLAVVDNGTSSILRLSEGEFGKLAWMGGRRKE